MNVTMRLNLNLYLMKTQNTLILITKLVLILAAFQSTIFQNVFAAEQGMNVALVLDTSGSMKKNDPNQLRIQAAKLFVSLLSRNDKVTLIGFSNRAYPITPLLTLNTKKNEKKLISAIEKMNSKGQYTNLHDAILSGYELLKKQKNSRGRNHIILMSDGKMDLGNRETNLRLLEKTLDDLTPKLLEDEIKIHTIAFTKDSYIPLLKLAAEDTQGQFVLLENADGIHQVFENIFEREKSPEMLPINEDSFVVDKSVKEVTIIASKFKPHSIISLESPDGNEITIKTSKENNANINWYKARKFDLITIRNPAAGYWLIKYSEGGNKAYIVSDIKLDIKSTKKRANPGAPLHIQAFLKKKNRKIKNKYILNSTKFLIKITSPVGSIIENTMKDDGSEIGSERKDGIYGISYVFDKEGPYKVEITAQGETFDRKKTLFIDVKSTTFKTPFVIKQTIIKEPDILDTINTGSSTKLVDENNLNDNKDEHNIEEDSLNRSEVKNKDLHAKESGHNEATADELSENNHSEKNSKVSKEEHDENSDSHTEGEDSEHDSEDQALKADSNFGVKDALIAFISFNILLLSLGGGYYIWYRRKQKQKDKDSGIDDQNDGMESGNDASTIDNSESGLELETEDSLSTSISDIDLEEELSSILEDDKL